MAMGSRNPVVKLFPVGDDENSTLCLKIVFPSLFNTANEEALDVGREDITSSGTEGQQAR